ncbi:MAG TPA: methyltransferase domain-containing protein [Polyangiaceae bacterium]|nr:methyltransferase domain-containing protein [Polyangiaceae bacterium]
MFLLLVCVLACTKSAPTSSPETEPAPAEPVPEPAASAPAPAPQPTLAPAKATGPSAEELAAEGLKPAEREPDVRYVPTPHDVVLKMLELGRIKKTDVVYDLGCGDGRIVVAAAKKFGVKAFGYDIDPVRVREARKNVKDNGVENLVAIEQADIFKLDLSKANVVMLYLLPQLNVQLIPQLQKLKPGSRIVSHAFDMQGTKPDKQITMTSTESQAEHEIYLWTAPLKLEK